MKKIFFLAMISAVAFSCNKKNNSNPGPPATTTGAPAQPTTTVMSNGAGNATSIHGVLQAEKFTIPAFGGLNSYESRAAFSANPMPIGAYHMMGGIMATFGQNAGVLKLNGTTLKFDASTPAQQNRYTDTLSSRNYSAGASWDLAANSSFGSFTTTVTRGYPVISNVNYLPASVSKASGFTLTMGPGNYSNTDSLIVFVSGVGGVSPFKHLPGNATSVSFSPLDLSTLGTGSGLLIVFGINYSNMMVSGKNYVFIMQHDLSNPVQINP